MLENYIKCCYIQVQTRLIGHAILTNYSTIRKQLLHSLRPQVIRYEVEHALRYKYKLKNNCECLSLKIDS